MKANFISGGFTPSNNLTTIAHPVGQKAGRKRNKMAWSTIRKATDQDFEALNKAARRFSARHDLTKTIGNDLEISKEAGMKTTWHKSLETYLAVLSEEHSDVNDWGHSEAVTMARLWKRCVRRALGEPTADGIAHGYVGLQVE
jgi:hypothetical protein